MPWWTKEIHGSWGFTPPVDSNAEDVPFLPMRMRRPWCRGLVTGLIFSVLVTGFFTLLIYWVFGVREIDGWFWAFMKSLCVAVYGTVIFCFSWYTELQYRDFILPDIIDRRDDYSDEEDDFVYSVLPSSLRSSPSDSFPPDRIIL